MLFSNDLIQFIIIVIKCSGNGNRSRKIIGIVATTVINIMGKFNHTITAD